MIFTRRDLIFNNYNFSRILRVEDIRRPMVHVENEFLQGADRYFHRGVSLRPLPIDIDVRIIEKSRQDVETVRQTLMKYLVPNKPAKLYTRRTDLYDIAILDGQIDFERFWRTGFATLRFQTMHAYRFGEEIRTTIQSGDIVIPKGDRPTRPIFTMRPAEATNQVKVTNQALGEFVEVQYDIQPGSELVVDCDKEIATYNGYNILKYCSFMSDFFSLLPDKENRITLEGTEQSDLQYITRWL